MNGCSLKRCQGVRGCICPKGNVVGSYSCKKVITNSLPVINPKTKIVETTKKPSSTQKSLVKEIKKKQVSEIIESKEKANSSSMNTTENLPLIIEETVAPVISTLSVNETLSNQLPKEITVIFNHYKRKFPIVNGSLSSTILDEEYSISFAFPKSKIHLTIMGPSDFSYEEMGLNERPKIQEDPVGIFQDLKENEIYYIDIEENDIEKEIYEKLSDMQLKQAVNKRQVDEQNQQICSIKQESCSCIEGNPCIDKYCCKDFENRYEIAKKHGWKGFQ